MSERSEKHENNQRMFKRVRFEKQLPVQEMKKIKQLEQNKTKKPHKV